MREEEKRRELMSMKKIGLSKILRCGMGINASMKDGSHGDAETLRNNLNSMDCKRTLHGPGR
jgi:hypothetical protein